MQIDPEYPTALPGLECRALGLLRNCILSVLDLNSVLPEAELPPAVTLFVLFN